MPNAGELKVYCEAIASRRERFKRLGELPAPAPSRRRLAAPAPAPGDLASIFVPADHVRYPELRAWSETANERQFEFGRSSDNRVGIWIAWEIWDNRQTVARKAPAAPTGPLTLSDAAKEVMCDIDEARAMGRAAK
jgi:hypothetical protein